MKKITDTGRVKNARQILTTALLAGTAMTMASASAYAQDKGETASTAEENAEEEGNAIIVSGIRSSLQSALAEKRESNNLVEIIQAEDIGKLPDQNLAEVLENITGVQITRTAGIGTAVQIRGTDENRTEINGVSTVGSGAGRGGISFEDLPASIISSLEVTKVPDASTIEGSVGGTINLRTLRPSELDDFLLNVRVQGENSDIADTFLPRISGTIGNNWDVGGGEFGFVLSGSYARQDVSIFRPRVDRDGVVLPTDPLGSAEEFPFLRVQFLDQDFDNFEFETLNLVGSLEYSPTPGLKFYFDGIYNDQERTQESTRVQVSGVSLSAPVDTTINSGFETINFGSLDGPNGPIAIPPIQAVTSGIIIPGEESSGSNRLNPNLRSGTNTGARVTKSEVYRLGAEWEKGPVWVRIEGAVSTSDSTNPNLTTVLDFINPNDTQPSEGISLDNGVPFEFDLNNQTLQFGIAQGLASTPTTAQLLDPSNYELRQVQQNNDIAENREIALRFDSSFDTEGSLSIISSIDLGYRFNETSSLNNDSVQNFNFTNDGAIDDAGNITNFGSFNRPRGDLFANLLIENPTDVSRVDNRSLFINNFLVIDPALTFTDPDAVRAALNTAIDASNAARPDRTPVPNITVPTEEAAAFFDITEQTHALYAQANINGYDVGLPIRGNLGLRYIRTDLDSIGNTIVAGVASPVREASGYSFFLPRFNLVVEPAEDFLIRGGIARDINRPDFDNLSTSASFGTGANTPVEIGNPALVPEAVWSFDLAVDWYFAPASVLSVGAFHKVRSNLFSALQEDPPGNQDDTGQLNIDITDPCEAGGIFNPIADRNINSPEAGEGICVPVTTTVNGAGNTTQTGIEIAFQHDLSALEDSIGFASGFGFIGNYTFQFTGGSAEDFPENFRAVGGPRDIFTDFGVVNAQDRIRLPNLSRHSFNTTLFYDKFGVNARVRYTWRSSFTSTDAFQIGVPRITGTRGQLNASLNYDVTDNINIGVEGINLLQGDQRQFCVNNNSLLCFQGITDRRLLGSINFTF